MKMFLLSFLFVSSAFAVESQFLVNQQRAKASIEADYLSSNAIVTQPGVQIARRSTENTNALQLSYNYPYREDVIFNVSTRLMDRQYNSKTYGQSHRVSGFSDLHFGVKSGTVFEELTMTYGAELQISPASAKNPYEIRETNEFDSTTGNNFSGIQMLSPFLGIESYFGQVALGGRLTPKFYTAQSLLDNGDSNAKAVDAGNAIQLEGFVEFPLLAKIDVGFTAGTGRSLQSFNTTEEYMASAYGNYRFDKTTAFTLGLQSETLRYPLQVENNEISLGLRRSL